MRAWMCERDQLQEKFKTHQLVEVVELFHSCYSWVWSVVVLGRSFEVTQCLSCDKQLHMTSMSRFIICISKTRTCGEIGRLTHVTASTSNRQVRAALQAYFHCSRQISSDTMGEYCLTYKDVEEAVERIKPAAHVTPVMTSKTMDGLAGRELFFKCELFQKVGAFKFRGAYNAISKLLEKAEDKSSIKVVTHSSGNHGQALALAAKMKNVPAFIVMQNISPKIKVTAVKGYGATVVECEPGEKSREETKDKVAKEQGAIFISSSQHPDVIAGQGTMGVELLNQVPDLDAIVAPVSGGGMVAGICIAAKHIKPDIKIFAAEPLNADDCAKSFAAKERIPLPWPPDTVADGLKTSVGPNTWPIIKDNVEDVITVTEEEIIKATKLMWERVKLCVEPSAGTAVAAVLSDKFRALPPSIKKVGIILSGGNLDLSKLSTWF
ncbi:LOW QUALITY PROTEIN: serine racemase-like [Ptychodera flava]|uniref:LOW QUALITY PROTEIN: serine racemase-like n=1 Tax=Ptychodera flava TaxID=63121 RepID=UPI00396AB07E